MRAEINPPEKDVIDLSLSGMAYGGEAFGRDQDGRMIFVPFACSGERVLVEIVESRKRWARAELLQVTQPSIDRRQPRCTHFGQCGGCHYQYLSYSAQLEFKRDIVVDQLHRIGGIQTPPVERTIPSPAHWNTRNRMGFSLTEEGKIGLVGRSPEEVIELSECHLPCTSIGELWPKLEFERGLGLDKVSIHAGYQDELLIVIQGANDVDPDFTVELPVNIVLTQQERIHVVAGQGHIFNQVGDTLFRVSGSSFFQVNTDLTPTLVEQLLIQLDPGPGMRIFDLYSGVGLFSHFLCERGASVVAVEESPSACADYEFNLREQDRVELYQAKVEAVLPVLTEEPDAIILDPPRTGVDPVVVDQLIRLKAQRLFYISCDPATFARDAKRLTSGGYKLELVLPLDLFPQTYHIEILSTWSLNKNGDQ